MEDKINVSGSERSPLKRRGKTLTIIGSIFLVIALILCGLFISLVFPLLLGESDFGNAISAVIGIIYFLIPGIIVDFISIAINAISYGNANKGKGKIYNLVTLILSIMVMVIFVSLFICLRFK